MDWPVRAAESEPDRALSGAMRLVLVQVVATQFLRLEPVSDGG